MALKFGPELLLAWKQLQEDFKTVARPTLTNSCGCSFCLTDAKIFGLMDIAQDELPASGDVRVYIQNVLGTIGTEEDLTFLLPSLARIWAEKLDDADTNDAYRDNFWEALNRNGFFADLLPPGLEDAASRFIRAALLDRLSREGPLRRIKGQEGVHFWIGDVSGYARVADDFEKFWTQWWTLSSPGHAVAAVEYASCLAFKAENNPIFHKWTPIGGGGQPSLCESGGPWWAYWRKRNLEFMRKRLTQQFLESSMERACTLIREPGEKELAEAVHAAVRDNASDVTRRIEELFEP